MIQSIDGLNPQQWIDKNKNTSDFNFKIAQFLEDWAISSSITCYSSGSTGKPKAFTFTKAQFIASAQGTIEHFQIPSNAKALLCLSPDYIAGKMMLARAIVGSWNLITCPPDQLDTLVLKESIDFAAVVPLQAEKLIRTGNMKYIHQLLVGGQKYPSFLSDIDHEFRSQIFESYGMTETLSHVAVKNRLAPFFTILKGNKISINEAQCVVIQCSYLNSPLTTNDLGILHEANQLEIIGRKDWVINSGGIKYQIEDLEEKYHPLLPHQSYFVIGKEDPKLGQKIVLYVEGDYIDLPWDTLQIGRYEIPKETYFIPNFVRNNGKIMKQASIATLNTNE